MKPWQKRLAGGLLIAGASYFFFPLAVAAVRTEIGLLTAAVYLVAYLFSIVVLPLGALWLGGFVYSVFLRPWLRAWRIHRIRNARAFREALERGRGRDS